MAQSFGQSLAQQFSFFEGSLFVANAVELRFRRESLPPVQSSVAAVELPLDSVPAGALVRSAIVTITAQAPGNARIGSVAEVRAATGSFDDPTTSVIVDFGAMRTVGAIQSPVAIDTIQPWMGTQFGEEIGPESRLGATLRTFPEIQAERLLLGFGESTSAAEIAGSADASVLIPTPPTDLELLVAGTRALFRPGPARANTDADGYVEEVDVTAAVQAAVDAGVLPVVVTLRAAVPGVLGVSATLDFLDTFVVAFPDGIARVVEAPAEGVSHLAIPLPSEAVDWEIAELQLTVTARVSPERVSPSVGPALSGEAELVIEGDRAIVVGLPEDRLATLATLTAIRLPVRVGADGAELAGAVLEDAGGLPGAPAPRGQLGPVTLEPGGSVAEPRWITLPFAEPWPLVPGDRVWVELQLVRGQVVWPLAEPATLPSGDAPLRRRTPSGSFRVLSSAQGVATTSGAVRVVGEPPPNAPLSALEAQIEGAPEIVAFTPTADGVRVAIRVADGVTAATPGAFAGGALQVRLTASAAGPYSFSAGKVAYT
jgi:hypothetical protein